MSYATIEDIQNRIGKELDADEITIATSLLEGAAIQIDAYNVDAGADRKKEVSIRVVSRMMGNSSDYGVPIGTTQSSQQALGYSASWTVGGGGAFGEIYLKRDEKFLLGRGNRIGSYSPIQELVRSDDD